MEADLKSMYMGIDVRAGSDYYAGRVTSFVAIHSRPEVFKVVSGSANRNFVTTKLDPRTSIPLLR